MQLVQEIMTLETLCRHPNGNMMAINKPTKYPEVSTNSWQTGIINQDCCDGVENYGMKSAYNVAPGKRNQNRTSTNIFRGFRQY